LPLPNTHSPRGLLEATTEKTSAIGLRLRKYEGCPHRNNEVEMKRGRTGFSKRL